VIDDLFDENPFDLDRPEEVVLAAGSGILDDGASCSCWCDCEHRVEWPGDECRACESGRHRDPLDPADTRR
jgi:hypothetical protein